MEAGGLAVGVVALAGLFTNAMDCFEYVQLGRSFGTNFQTSVLKLDNARLRLSRWGEAVGLSATLENVASLQAAVVNKENIPKAERALGQILELFARAECISAEYRRSAETEESNLAALDVHADMDNMGQTLHEKMRKLCIKRQNKSTMRQKAKWALYEEKHFNRLIEDIIGLIDTLFEVFPAVEQEQRLKLCEFEVSEIGVESLSALIEIVRSQDKDLEAATSAATRAFVSEPDLREATFATDCLEGGQARHDIQQLQQQDCEPGGKHGHSWRSDDQSLIPIQHTSVNS
jgi:hypothetical protein